MTDQITTAAKHFYFNQYDEADTSAGWPTPVAPTWLLSQTRSA